MNNFAEMNAEYEKWFSHKPARSCVAVKALPKGVPVEIECKHGGILLRDRSLRGSWGECRGGSAQTNVLV